MTVYGCGLRISEATDALFIIPADVGRVELIVGRSEDATAKIHIELRH
jgi:hypothetical protein